MKNHMEALNVLKEATTLPPASKRTKEAMANGPVQARLHKHTKLWAFYADLQVSLPSASLLPLTSKPHPALLQAKSHATSPTSNVANHVIDLATSKLSNYI